MLTKFLQNRHRRSLATALIDLQHMYDQSVALDDRRETWRLWHEIMSVEDELGELGAEVPSVAARRGQREVVG